MMRAPRAVDGLAFAQRRPERCITLVGLDLVNLQRAVLAALVAVEGPDRRRSDDPLAAVTDTLTVHLRKGLDKEALYQVAVLASRDRLAKVCSTTAFAFETHSTIGSTSSCVRIWVTASARIAVFRSL